MKKLNLKIFFVIIGMLKQVLALTLNEAIENAVQNSDIFGQKNAEIASYNAQKFNNFEKAFLPSVSLLYNDIRDKQSDYTIKSRIFDISYSISNLYKGSFNFYGGHQYLNYIKLNADISKNTFIIEVVSLYLKILEIEKNIEVYQKSLEVNSKMLQQIERRVKNGSTPLSSLHLIEVETEQIESSLDYEKNRLENAKSTFTSKVKINPTDLTEPNQIDLKYDNFESFVNAVKMNNNHISAIKSKNISAKYSLAYSSSDFLPDLNLSYQKDSNVDVFGTKTNNSKVVLSAKFYLYKPGLISDVIAKSYEYRASNYQLKDEMQTQINKAQEFWSLYEYYKKALKSKEKIVSVRNMIVNEQMQNYSVGRIELTDVLNEEKKLREAELDLIKIKFETLINIYNMKNLSGESLI